MSIRTRWRSWRRRRRLSKGASAQKAGLREFVYLDDVSVYSLYASRFGSIAAEFTEGQAATLRTEAATSLGANVVLAKGDISTSLQSEQSRSTQVLRKAIIQTTFKEWYERESSSLVLGLGAESASGTPGPVTDLDAAQQSGDFALTVVPSTTLRRGSLVEVEVELETEPIFQAGSVMSSILEIVRENPVALGVQASDLSTAAAITVMLDKLLGGLVPIRARAIDYEVVATQDKQWVVHCSIASRLELPSGCQRHPLFLTGVAERALFWKDIRRVLFAASRYRVLARVATDGLQLKWTPVKLVDELRRLAPHLATGLEAANEGMFGVFADATVASSEDEPATLQHARLSYGFKLATALGISVDPDELRRVSEVDHAGPASTVSVLERRRLFEPVTQFIEEKLGAEVDPNIAVACRSAALREAGFAPDGTRTRVAPVQPITGDADERRLLDTEIIAIYW